MTKTNNYTREFNQFYDAVVKALENKDEQELQILERRDGRWFEDVMDELITNRVLVAPFQNENPFICAEDYM